MRMPGAPSIAMATPSPAASGSRANIEAPG
jgi:hypothetical protein